MSGEMISFPTFSERTEELEREEREAEELINTESIPAVGEKEGKGEISLSSPSCILIEKTTGRVLFEKNADEPLPIASVTKVMTILLIMEAIDSGDLSYEDKITVSDTAASMGGSQAYLEPGEEITCRDLLKAVVVSSANDGAVAFAEHIAGSVDTFVMRMNERAEALGMTHTSFVNPTGLDDSEIHYSSARDVALMSAELMKHEGIKEFTTIWMDSIRDGKFGLVNTNKLIRFYPGATGLKTGYTSKAGFCLSAAAEKNGLELIAVVLHGNTGDERFSDAKTMLNYGFANYAVFSPEIEIPKEIPLSGGKQKTVKISCNVEGYLCKKSDIGRLSYSVDISAGLTAPVEEKQSVGSVVYKLDGKTVYETPIYTSERAERLSVGDIFGEILKRLA